MTALTGCYLALGACFLTQAAPPASPPPLRVHESYLPAVAMREAARAPSAPPRTIASLRIDPTSKAAKWLKGYWDFDPASRQFIWVDGVWRVPPPGLTWVDSYWARGSDGAYYRVAGFWSSARRASYETKAPPPAPPAEDPGKPPGPDRFFVAGYFAPKDEGVGIAWKPGFWSRLQTGWTWVPAAWLERPAGWAFQPGFWTPAQQWSTPPRPLRSLTLSVDEAERLARIQSGPPQPLGPADRNVLAEVTASINSVLGARPDGYVAAPVPALGNSPTNFNSVGDALQIPGRAAEAYYIGRSAGSSYPSFSMSSAATPGSSFYVGRSASGSSYPSFSTSPSFTPGASFYAGRSEAATYPTFSTSGVSVGGYGYGTTAPGGGTGGQVGGTGP